MAILTATSSRFSISRTGAGKRVASGRSPMSRARAIGFRSRSSHNPPSSGSARLSPSCGRIPAPTSDTVFGMAFAVKRVYDPPSEADGYRVLVDRLWPRGVSRAAAELDEWAKELAPSAELRRWFDHD